MENSFGTHATWRGPGAHVPKVTLSE
jgi:hypothetical protein